MILKIPQSGDLVKISTILSGNTFGARWWSDGKMEAPMMPDEPWLRRHPGTGEMFWSDACAEVALEEPWEESSNRIPWATFAQYPTVGFGTSSSRQILVNVEPEMPRSFASPVAVFPR